MAKNKKTKGAREHKMEDQSGPAEGSQTKTTTSTRSATPETNLALVGPPTTPDKTILSSTILTPKLKKSMAAEDLEAINADVTSSPIFRHHESVIKKHGEQLLEAFRRIKKEQAQVEAKLDEYVASLSLLDKTWADGHINLSKGVYVEEKRTILDKQQQLMTTVSSLRTMGSQLAARWSEDMLLGTRETYDDWATIDATIRCYPELAYAKKSVKSKRTPKKEKQFRHDLIKAYGSESDEWGWLWCPISQRYVENKTVAAHIVNANIGEVTARALFGDDEEHIWSLHNGLIIHKDFERLLDNGKAVILPFSDSPSETRFRFVLLTDDIGRMTSRVTTADLRDRELEFKNRFRPAKKYLYFKFAITLLRRRRGEVPGHLEDLHKLPSPSRALWASPGPYLKKSILYKFSRQLGCLSVEEANRFWNVEAAPTEPISDEMDDLSATLATEASLSSLVRPREGRKKSSKVLRSVSPEVEEHRLDDEFGVDHDNDDDNEDGADEGDEEDEDHEDGEDEEASYYSNQGGDEGSVSNVRQ
ncbi:hypothetical protein SCUCBS95973_004141 [Sporothrix curviconia]|uniref:HNH nuclease domain-containing protein n=1 Tax=Sporothrix curviconia TaxID=1260050 RepID=A0ABP0BMN7_9PEZI